MIILNIYVYKQYRWTSVSDRIGERGVVCGERIEIGKRVAEERGVERSVRR